MTETEISEIKRALASLEKRVSALEGLPTKSKPRGKRESVREFLLRKNPQSDREKTLVVCYFLEKSELFESFNARDIEKGFRDARESVPGNIADMIQKNIAKGYMMQTKEAKDGIKAYVLTNTGEGAVEQMSGKPSQVG